MVSGLTIGTLFGIQAFFAAAPVTRQRLPLVLGGLAAAIWIVGLVRGADLCLGGIWIIAALVAAATGNLMGSAVRKRSEMARA